MMTSMNKDPFGAAATLDTSGGTIHFFRLQALSGVDRLPFSLRVLLESTLRNVDGVAVTEKDVRAIADWTPTRTNAKEIPFIPARVLLQDFTGVPAVVDLAAMRDAMNQLGGDPQKINPLIPADLVIDHSVGRRLRLERRPGDQRGPGVYAESRAVSVSSLGSAGVQRFPGRTAGDGHRASGQPRVSSQCGRHENNEGRDRCMPRQSCRYGQSHHDD